MPFALYIDYDAYYCVTKRIVVTDHREEYIKQLLSAWRDGSTAESSGEMPDVSQYMIKGVGPFLSISSYYYYVLNLADEAIDYVHPDAEKLHDVKVEDYDLNAFYDLFHPDDLERFLQKVRLTGQFMFQHIPKSHMKDYIVVDRYRLKMKGGQYQVVMHQAQALEFDSNNRMSRVLVLIATAPHLHLQVNDTISFISDKHPDFLNIKLGTTDFDSIDQHSDYSLRELEIAKLMAEGFDQNTIADRLNISPLTVKTHKQNMMRRTGSKNAVELVANLLKNGII